MLCISILFAAYGCLFAETNGQNNGTQNQFATKEEIQTLFTLKRKQHFEAIQTLLNFQKYEQKYEMIKKIFTRIFEVIQTSRVKVENSNYILGEELPNNEVIDHIFLILDNCAFFGNIVLKLPDITTRLLKENNQWVNSHKWCLTFSTSSNLLDEKSLQMFNLSAQQLNLIPRSDDFINPYEEKPNSGTKQKLDNNPTLSNKANSKQVKVKHQTRKLNKPRLSKAEL